MRSTPAILTRLDDRLRELGSVVVAFSGGVDSGLLAYRAHQVLGDRAVAVTAVSDSLAPDELDACGSIAEEWGMAWVGVGTDELSRPEYVANGLDRCFHCKSALMDQLAPLAEDRSGTVVLGVNLDDLDEYRPGQAAASGRGAVFPLVDAGFTKADVREQAKLLELSLWDKPASACLASRIPHGTLVTVSTLSAVARAETGLKRLGFDQLRVRHYGELARVEVPTDRLEEVFHRRLAVIEAVKSAGYKYVTVDLEGFRSGNLSPGR